MALLIITLSVLAALGWVVLAGHDVDEALGFYSDEVVAERAVDFAGFIPFDSSNHAA